MNLRFAICNLRFSEISGAAQHRGRALLNRKSKIENRKFRSGYSFTEVMFAVVILGIGFIMIAAMFPAALHQSKTTMEETTGGTLVHGAVTDAKTILVNSTFVFHAPPTDPLY